MRNLLISILIFPFLPSCFSGRTDTVFEKNACYAARLELLRGDNRYLSVHRQFAAIFPQVERQVEALQRWDNCVDPALFLNKDSTKCVILVLQRNASKELFGAARAFEGRREGNVWTFILSKEYIFNAAFFRQFDKNSTENISLLARYSVLMDGHARVDDCDIDEEYWFHNPIDRMDTMP